MKKLMIGLLISLSFIQYSFAETELEAIYGSNGEDAIQKCIEHNVQEYIKANDHLPVIDVAELKEKFEALCRAMAEKEIPEDTTNDPYFKETTPDQQLSNILTLELLSQYNIQADQLIQFYSENQFTIISTFSAATILSLTRIGNTLTMGGKGKLLKGLAFVSLGMGATAANAHVIETYQTDIDFNPLRNKIMQIKKRSLSLEEQVQALTESLTSEELEFLLKQQQRIYNEEMNRYYMECAALPTCQAT